MSLGSLQEFDSIVPKDAELKELDVQRFRANLISKPPTPTPNSHQHR
jgi:hypothetical protein